MDNFLLFLWKARKGFLRLFPKILSDRLKHDSRLTEWQHAVALSFVYPRIHMRMQRRRGFG